MSSPDSGGHDSRDLVLIFVNYPGFVEAALIFIKIALGKMTNQLLVPTATPGKALTHP